MQILSFLQAVPVYHRGAVRDTRTLTRGLTPLEETQRAAPRLVAG